MAPGTSPRKFTQTGMTPDSRPREALYKDAAATLYDLCEADGTLGEIERIARRVLGGAHPLTKGIEIALRRMRARAALRARTE